MAKNIINDYPGYGSYSTSSTTATSAGGWGAPSDGSRTNIATCLAPASGVNPIPENRIGYGVRLDMLNDQGQDISVTDTIVNDDFTTLDVTRRRWSTQRDKEYLDFYYEDGADGSPSTGYQNGCLKIYIKKTCWLHIEGVACAAKPDNLNTSTIGIGIWRNNGGIWYDPPVAGGTYTNEPAADGLCLPLSSIHFYTSGQIIKIGIVSTWGTGVFRGGKDTGALNMHTNFCITRISDN